MFMFVLMIVLFIVGYTIIALEHPLKINKSATALLLGVLLWVCAVIGGEGILVNTDSLRQFAMDHPGNYFLNWLVHSQLLTALGEVSEILFFLMGAMTIVELIDTHGGFTIITKHIKTTKKVKLLWVISIVAFFLSAVLDNLTTSIVMVALLRKLIGDRKERWFYASMIIIAANAGGAWSPIGDVTTIMLWIGNRVTALNIIEMTFLASLVSLLVPLIVLSFILKGHVERPELSEDHIDATFETKRWESNFFFFFGVGALLFVPVFKTITHLPPYLGMLGGLSVLWIISEILNRRRPEVERSRFSVSTILTKIDMPSILFFLGILMAVNALATVGHLELLAVNLDKIPLLEPEKYYVINIIIGLVSSIVDNVPLVAGAMGMYHFPTDHFFWEFLAYCAGTGGSILIIGSAAGVAVMGMEKIDFIWYLKKISWIALIGYFAGALTFIGEKAIREYIASESKAVKTEVEMSEEGVKKYLSETTFYTVNDSEFDIETGEIKDSTIIRFTDFALQGQQYFGLSLQSLQYENNPKNFENHSVVQSLAKGECVISQLNDTIAAVIFGKDQLFVTQSGKVYLVFPNGGSLELKKAN